MSPTSPFRDAAELDVPLEAQAYPAAVETTAPAVMSPFRDVPAPLPEHADGESEWQPEALDASFEEVRPEDAGAGPRPAERAAVRDEIRAGRRNPTELTNKVFLLRHPERTGTPIAANEPALKAEWLKIRAELVVPLLLSGPEIGPIHDRAVPVSPDLRKGVPAGAVLSPLAITTRGLRRAPRRQAGTIAAVVVHTTSRGPGDRSRKGGYRRPAIQYALDHYIDGTEGFPHYVIDFTGTIYATCDERLAAAHAGWGGLGGASHFKEAWTAPQWWSRIWSPQGAATPIDLLPKGARSPNQRTIGIELLLLPDMSYTAEQYRALARLVVDIQRRNPDLRISSAPSRALLGHEDFTPVTGTFGRANAQGGWDPGAHRTNPYFSWSRLWSEIQAVAPGFGARPAGSPPPASRPSRELPFSVAEAQYGDWSQLGELYELAPEGELEEEGAAIRTTPYLASELDWPGATDAQRAFMRAVYERMVQRAQSSGRSFIGDLPAGRLKPIYGRHRARADAAEAARALLEAARRELAAEGLSERVAVGIVSAYRSAAEQWLIWQGKRRDGTPKPRGGFPYYYAQTAGRRRRLADEHGPEAVELQAEYLGRYIAAPGFSDHNSGIAIDFGTGEVGKGLGKIGRRSWFHRWLVANAARFDFVPLASESWHWEYHPGRARTPAREAEDLDALEAESWLEVPGEASLEDEGWLEAEPWSEGEPGLEAESWYEAESSLEAEPRLEGEPSFEFESVPVASAAEEAPAGGVRAGRLEIPRAPILERHRGRPPALVLGWNDMPAAERIDVVVHLHGFSRQAMTLPRDIERYSGLDLRPLGGEVGAGRARPTLTVLPRGHMTGRRVGAQRPGKPPPDFFAYTFPELVRADGLAKLVAFALQQFASRVGAATPPRVDRLILTAHSGGGAALLQILEHHDPHEVHAFDALYHDASALARWAVRRIDADGAAGALRVFHKPGTQRFSRQLEDAIAPALGRAADDVRRRYRVEASTLGHWQIPREYGWRILADASADVPRAHGRDVRRRESAEEAFEAGAFERVVDALCRAHELPPAELESADLLGECPLCEAELEHESTGAAFEDEELAAIFEAAEGADDDPPASAFSRAASDGDRFRALLPLLERHRGDIPLDFLLGWIDVESGGRIDRTTAPPLDERGFFQIHVQESRYHKLDHPRLTTDPDYSVRSGIHVVRFYAALARRRYPWIPDGSELFWRVVKLQHAMGSGLARGLLKAMRRHGVTPTTWEQIKAFETTAAAQQLHKLLRVKPGRFARNVDEVFARGRRRATALGR